MILRYVFPQYLIARLVLQLYRYDHSSKENSSGLNAAFLFTISTWIQSPQNPLLTIKNSIFISFISLIALISALFNPAVWIIYFLLHLILTQVPILKVQESLLNLIKNSKDTI